MRGEVGDRLRRSLHGKRVARVRPTAHAAGQPLRVEIAAADKPWRAVIKHVALDRVARGIAERAHARHPAQMLPPRQVRAAVRTGSAAGPRFAVDQLFAPAVARVQRLADAVHQAHRQKAHQVEAEAVDVVFLRPVEHGVEDIARAHAALGRQLVAAAGAVRQPSIPPLPVVRPRRAGEQRHVEVHRVVIDHVHHHAQAALVQRGDRGLELADAYLAVRGVGGVAALRHVVVDRIVAPVVAAGRALIDGAEVEHRHQLHMRDAQSPQIRHTRRVHAVAAERRVRLAEGEVFAAVRRGDAAGRVGGKVPDMHLGDHILRRARRGAVVLPAGRIRARQVDDHAAPTVQAAGPGIRVARAPGDAVHGHVVIVIRAVEIARILRPPQSPLPAPERDAREWLAPAPVVIQIERNSLRRGRPQRKARARLPAEAAQRLLTVKLSPERSAAKPLRKRHRFVSFPVSFVCFVKFRFPSGSIPFWAVRVKNPFAFCQRILHSRADSDIIRIYKLIREGNAWLPWTTSRARWA